MASLLSFLIISFTATILFLAIKFTFNLYRKRKMMKHLPGPPIQNFFLGNIEDLMCPAEERVNLTMKRKQEYGSIFCTWLMGQPVVSLLSANYAELYFNSQEISKKSFTYSFLDRWIGQGLLLIDGPLWHYHRKLITPSFHFSILNSFFDVFVDNSLYMVEKLRELPAEQPIDIFQLMHMVSLENICETAMGVKLNAFDNPQLEYIKATERVASLTVKRFVRPWLWRESLYMLTPDGKRWIDNIKIIHALTFKVLQDKKDKMKLRSAEIKDHETDEIGGKKRLAFLDVLLNACESESKPLSEKELVDEVNTFMFAGHDTTASALSWSTFLLGLHPDIQEKCFREQEKIFQESNRRPTNDDIKEMKYLEQVIKETLRIYPSVPRISRMTDRDTKFGEYTLAKGTSVFLNIYVLHRDQKYFPDPEKFDPDRFSAENIAGRHPYAFVPFAAGSRNCIGQKYALLEIKIVLSYLLRHFIMESQGAIDGLKFELVLRSKKSLNVRFTRR